MYSHSKAFLCMNKSLNRTILILSLLNVDLPDKVDVRHFTACRSVFMTRKCAARLGKDRKKRSFHRKTEPSISSGLFGSQSKNNGRKKLK